MTFASIGDGARQFQLARQNSSLKSDLGRLSAELSSGQTSDRTAATNGRTSRLSGIEHSLMLLSAYQSTVRETGQLLGTMQSVLTAVDDKRARLAGELLLVNQDSPAFQIDEAGRSATSDFENIINTLNTRNGERSLFSGSAVDQPSFASPESILANLVSAAIGKTTSADIITSVESWFEDPDGFAKVGYLGDENALSARKISSTEVILLDVRGDSREFRGLIKAAAIAALADQLVGIDNSTKSDLLQASGINLQTAASQITQLQARVGFSEAVVAQTSVAQLAEQTTLTEAKGSYITVDPFDTATKLQAIQIQLETHYAITSRLSRLNLSAYL